MLKTATLLLTFLIALECIHANSKYETEYFYGQKDAGAAPKKSIAVRSQKSVNQSQQIQTGTDNTQLAISQPTKERSSNKKDKSNTKKEGKKGKESSSGDRPANKNEESRKVVGKNSNKKDQSNTKKETVVNNSKKESAKKEKEEPKKQQENNKNKESKDKKDNKQSSKGERRREEEHGLDAWSDDDKGFENQEIHRRTRELARGFGPHVSRHDDGLKGDEDKETDYEDEGDSEDYEQKDRRKDRNRQQQQRYYSNEISRDSFGEVEDSNLGQALDSDDSRSYDTGFEDQYNYNDDYEDEEHESRGSRRTNNQNQSFSRSNQRQSQQQSLNKQRQGQRSNSIIRTSVVDTDIQERSLPLAAADTRDRLRPSQQQQQQQRAGKKTRRINLADEEELEAIYGGSRQPGRQNVIKETMDEAYELGRFNPKRWW